MKPVVFKKKLIDVALPLEAINIESLRRKQKAPKGFPTSFHKWWAQRPLAACRAVIVASLIDDPSEHPDQFRTSDEQGIERDRLLRLIQELVEWENSHNERLYSEVWQEILKSTNGNPPPLCDPFCGGGSIPLEGQRLGLETYASDLNPVAVIINKAMIEIPPRFAGRRPINPLSFEDDLLIDREWHGSRGLAADVRYYAQLMRDEAKKQVGHLYPAIEITAEMARDRPDLRAYVGRHVEVVAWLWVRTVKSPNPPFTFEDVPLASTFIISSKPGKEAYIEPIIRDGKYHFAVRLGKPKDPEISRNGTKLTRGANFRCLLSGSPITSDYIKGEGRAGRMGARLMAAVAEGDRGRIYLPGTDDMERVAQVKSSGWIPDTPLPNDPRNFWTLNYGLDKFSDLFTSRQLVTLTVFSDLIQQMGEQVKNDAIRSLSFPDDIRTLEAGGAGAIAYADSLAIYLACLLDRMIYYGSSLTTWLPKDNALRDCMPRQALAMAWDFAECNPFSKSSGDVMTCANSVANYLDEATPRRRAVVTQCDARAVCSDGRRFLISTDPPYYDNISYADLSDYFYVWLRHSLRATLPQLFTTLTVPKAEELVASPYRHGGKDRAEAFFLDGMTQALKRLANEAHPEFPITIYYAFKQSETDDEYGTISTGWETFLEAVIQAGLSIEGTWPLRTEGAGRMIARGTNALASSIVLVCRPRAENARTATRREFLSALKEELPGAIVHLQRANIAPVDLAQAAIGPGMAVYTRYAKVMDATGKYLSVGAALSLINHAIDDAQTEQEGDFDPNTRWALAWFDHSGFSSGEYGLAETLSKAKNTTVHGLVEAGILSSKAGKVRLISPGELLSSGNGETHFKLTVWEKVHHMIRVLESGGEKAASDLLSRLGGQVEVVRELAYRLYTLCERKKRTQEALSYNGLVQSWPEITRLSRVERDGTQAEFFGQE